VRLLSDHKGRVFRYIYCLVRSLQDAEDVFQQTAVTLWDKFDEFDLTTNFATWACTIARFKALRYLESKGRQRLIFSEDLLGELVQNDACLPELHDARLNALAKCRERLSDADQRLLLACYGGEQSIIDAAAKVGRPVGSVYDSLSRIRRALYSCIERTLGSEGYSS
jgi:RNA polymerase sigma-70 factor (ECF subfamily)